MHFFNIFLKKKKINLSKAFLKRFFYFILFIYLDKGKINRKFKIQIQNCQQNNQHGFS